MRGVSNKHCLLTFFIIIYADSFNFQEQDPGALIMNIEASDEDHGRNADITYTILEENDWEQFEIDAKSGQLTFKNKLDRETKSSYEVH